MTLKKIDRTWRQALEKKENFSHASVIIAPLLFIFFIFSIHLISLISISYFQIFSNETSAYYHIQDRLNTLFSISLNMCLLFVLTNLFTKYFFNSFSDFINKPFWFFSYATVIAAGMFIPFLTISTTQHGWYQEMTFSYYLIFYNNDFDATFPIVTIFVISVFLLGSFSLYYSVKEVRKFQNRKKAINKFLKNIEQEKDSILKNQEKIVEIIKNKEKLPLLYEALKEKELIEELSKIEVEVVEETTKPINIYTE